jgi:FG-GAP-like repeat/FG-GAP repeat
LIVAGDFNRDGKVDLAVATLGSNTVSVFLGNGNGTFSLKSTLAAGDNQTGIATGNFNGDGNLDLAVSDYSLSTISIWNGNGDGTFSLGASGPTGFEPASVAVGDFNNDGALDIVTGNAYGTDVTVVLQQLPSNH